MVRRLRSAAPPKHRRQRARPVTPITTPGLYHRTEFDSTSPDGRSRSSGTALVDVNKVTGRTIGHLEVLDGTPFTNIETAIG